MLNTDLSDKEIIITGAMGAIAEYIVKALHGAGASLILTDILEEEQALARIAGWGIRGKFQYHIMDVTNKEQVEGTVSALFKKNPGINIAIGYAGGCDLHFFKETDADTFDTIFRLNFTGQTYFTRSVLARWIALKTSGHMIYTSSYVSRIPHQGIPAYASAKAALESFSNCLALEFAEHDIRFNIISPGNVAAGSSLKVFNENKEYREMVKRVTPLKRQNSPEAIANAFLYLCSGLADEVNGHTLKVDLGVSIPKIG